MKIRIKSLNSENDPNYVNIKVGEVYETVDAPEGGTPNAVYIQGANGPASLFSDEYDVVDDAALSEAKFLTAYNVKTKEKGCPILNAVITKTARGAYMAMGNSKEGQKLTTLLNEEKALDAIKRGVAAKGWM